MKTKTKVVVVGGGVVGVSALYHLAKKGWSDVVLIERKELTSGSTWHAAGLLPLFNMSYSVGQLHKYAVNLYKTLEEEKIELISSNKHNKKVKKAVKKIVKSGNNTPLTDDEKLIAIILLVFLGVVGAHRFYLGDIGMGVLYLLTGGLCGIGVLIDLIKLLTDICNKDLSIELEELKEFYKTLEEQISQLINTRFTVPT